MKRTAKEEQVAAFAKMTPEELQAAFARAQSDPYCRLLNEMEAVKTQEEAGELLATDYWQDLLTQLGIGQRARIMSAVRKIIDEKPVI